jgi:hypothetical protein
VTVSSMPDGLREFCRMNWLTRRTWPSPTGIFRQLPAPCLARDRGMVSHRTTGEQSPAQSIFIWKEGRVQVRRIRPALPAFARQQPIMGSHPAVPADAYVPSISDAPSRRTTACCIQARMGVRR